MALMIDTPFHRVAVDPVWPLTPMSDNRNRYILTLVEYATSFPEAASLPSIEAESVAEALLEIFSRVGFRGSPHKTWVVNSHQGSCRNL